RVYVTYTSMKELKGSGATNFTTRNKMITPSLEVEVSGANNCELEVEAGELSIDASGAANIKLTGKADELEIDASGACNIKAYELSAGRVDAEVSGVSNVDVTAQKKLDVKASGLSHVNYKGNPQIGVREVSKMSSLKKH
ncbi:MAG TPA: head GIN domain-containing protein, partial [Sphingobacteriaceae bacterium]